MSSRFHVSTLLVQTKERRDTACPVIARRLRHVRGARGPSKNWGLGPLGLRQLGRSGPGPVVLSLAWPQKENVPFASVRFTPSTSGIPTTSLLRFTDTPPHHQLGPHPDLRRAILFLPPTQQPTTTSITMLRRSHSAARSVLSGGPGALATSGSRCLASSTLNVHTPHSPAACATHAPGEITNWLLLAKRAGWSDPRANPCAALHARHLPLLPHVHPSSLSFFSFFLRFRSLWLKLCCWHHQGTVPVREPGVLHCVLRDRHGQPAARHPRTPRAHQQPSPLYASKLFYYYYYFTFSFF